MKKLLAYAILALLICMLPCRAETVEELANRIKALPNVIDAKSVAHGPFLDGAFGEISYARIVWLIDDGDVVRKESGEVIVMALGAPEEEVRGWLQSIPEILKPAPDPTPLGEDADIIAATGVKIVKAQIQRGEKGDAATVTGYEEVGADFIPVTFIVHVKGDQLVAARLSAEAAAQVAGITPK